MIAVLSQMEVTYAPPQIVPTAGYRPGPVPPPTIGVPPIGGAPPGALNAPPGPLGPPPPGPLGPPPPGPLGPPVPLAPPMIPPQYVAYPTAEGSRSAAPAYYGYSHENGTPPHPPGAGPPVPLVDPISFSGGQPPPPPPPPGSEAFPSPIP